MHIEKTAKRLIESVSVIRNKPQRYEFTHFVFNQSESIGLDEILDLSYDFCVFVSISGSR